MRKGAGLMIAGILIIVLGVYTVITGWNLRGEGPEVYDDWVENSSPGDSITITGMIAEKNISNLMNSQVFVYRFRGCSHVFISYENIADPGDTITVTIKKDSMDNPVVEYVTYTERCMAIGVVFLLLGVSLLAAGNARKNKSDLRGAYVPPDTVNGTYKQYYKRGKRIR